MSPTPAPGERRLRVLLAGTSFHTAYGGPALSVGRLARALAAAGVEVGLWSGDGSVATLGWAATTPGLTAATPGWAAATPGLTVATPGWAATTPGLTGLIGAPRAALAAFGPVDLMHDNGLWLPHNHALAVLARRLGVPRLVSTRGMLEPWALGHKRWKKRLAWGLYQRRDLRGAVCHHVTSVQEGRNLRELGLGVPIALVPNGVDVPPLVETGVAKGGDRRRVALFLGRLYPVKGLPLLLEAWGHLRPAGWRLRIAGPDEGGHRRALEARVAAAGLGAAVEFVGEVAAEAKAGLFATAELFVLPSLSESFGLSVAEALAHGVPVLTTRAVPWPELEVRGCGWRVAAEVQDLAGGLRQAMALGPAELATMGQRGRAWMAADFSWEGVARRMLALYRATLAGGEALVAEANRTLG